MPFERCPICYKYILPPGMIIAINTTRASDVFCNEMGNCFRVKCLACGFFVNPKLHTQWECDFAQRAYGRQKLDEQDVLAEAEMILKEARER